MPTRIVARNKDHLKAVIDLCMQSQGPTCNLNHIDVSAITDFGSLFNQTEFNGDVSLWDTSSAVHMDLMFRETAFMGDLSRWNVEKVQSMDAMFRSCPFNGDLSTWRPKSLLYSRRMFLDGAFNGDVSDWDPLQLSDAECMFHNAHFQQGLQHWRLPQYCTVADMLLHGFRGTLPTIEHQPPHSVATKAFGHRDFVEAYVQSTPFNDVHASVLLSADRECGWASQEMVRAAREVGEVGRAIGVNHQELCALVVQRFYGRLNNEPSYGQNLFESTH